MITRPYTDRPIRRAARFGPAMKSIVGEAAGGAPRVAVYGPILTQIIREERQEAQERRAETLQARDDRLGREAARQMVKIIRAELYEAREQP